MSCFLFTPCVNCLLCDEAPEEAGEVKQKKEKIEQVKETQKTSLVEYTLPCESLECVLGLIVPGLRCEETLVSFIQIFVNYLTIKHEILGYLFRQPSNLERTHKKTQTYRLKN
jgi:hypothetical protein